MNRPLVEVCVGSLDDALAAELAGADRLELCSSTELGGLTPSAGLIEAVLDSVDLPVVVMIRPRPGGFCYTKAEYYTAVREAKAALKYDIAGVVFGFLDSDGEINTVRSGQFVEIAEGRESVFHRAFDVVPDPLPAIDQLVEAKVTRLLTSGQRENAADGATLIRQIIERAEGQLQVLPGGGIRANNVCEIVEQTGCKQVHIGASAVSCDESLAGNPRIDFHTAAYLEAGRHRVVDQNSVAAVLDCLGR